MSDLDLKIAELETRLDSLVRTQIDFQTEIMRIRSELAGLRNAGKTTKPDPANPAYQSVPEIKERPTPPPPQRPTPPLASESSPRSVPPASFGMRPEASNYQSSPCSEGTFSRFVSSYTESAREDLEKFIGENLISKIGIVVLVLGVGIGAKYAIDNNLVRPLTRIIIAYIFGFGLVGLAVKLKPKYLNLSSVLISGGMAIMYFVTYFAYASYSLMPQSAAFVLMAMFTMFTVAAALVYLSYPFTWLIFGSWLLTKYRVEEHFYLAAIFAAVFFAIYYGATIVYRLITDEVRLIENSGLVLTNSFIFYGIGYGLIDSRESLHGFAGIFTAAHAALHFSVAQFVIRLRSSAVDVVQVLTILILTFATITIPVQFDGNHVTLTWSVEAALLFWFGRVKQIWLFEYFSYPIMILATGSLFADWATAYGDRTMYVSEFNRQPIANGDLITALVFVAAIAFIYLTNRDNRYKTAIDFDLVRPFGYAVAGIGLLVLYNAFRIEISNYHHVLGLFERAETLSGYPRNRDLGRLNIIWQLNYTMFFLISMCVVNLRKIRSKILAFAGVGLSLVTLLIFLTVGMQLLFVLRESYMLRDDGAFIAGPMNIAIRYISYAFACVLLYANWVYSRDRLLTDSIPAERLRIGFDGVFYSTILIVASCELVNIMAQLYIPDAYKLGLSILWGLYALLLIVIGISKNKKYLRIGAIILLTVTLAKLFLYDIADLDTIPKTILFVSLGILLLVISFLYNKYKTLIFKVSANPEEHP